MSSFPVTRLRRLRRTSGIRSLVRETRLDLGDFVMPLFVGPEAFANDDLPGLARHSVESIVAEAEELERLGVRAVILFGIPDEDKDEEGSGAYDDDGVVQRALRALGGSDLVLLTDVCLCEYTSHGHCGVIRDGEVSNDETLELIARTGELTPPGISSSARLYNPLRVLRARRRAHSSSRRPRGRRPRA